MQCRELCEYLNKKRSDKGLTGWQCNAIHKTIVEDFKHAVVYGSSVKHQPQRVGLSHELADEDIREYYLSLETDSTRDRC